MSLTGRPSRPPFELISCSQICAPSSACWPAPASEPVCAMLKPILIGSPPCASATLEPTAGEIRAAPMPAFIWRRVIGWFMTFLPKFWTHRLDGSWACVSSAMRKPSGNRSRSSFELLARRRHQSLPLISRKAATSAGSSKSNYINSLAACTEKQCRMSGLYAGQLFGLYVCSSHYFRPLLGIADKQPFKFRGRALERGAAELAQPRIERRVGEPRINFLVKQFDDLGWGLPTRGNAEPDACFITWHGFAD